MANIDLSTFYVTFLSVFLFAMNLKLSEEKNCRTSPHFGQNFVRKFDCPKVFDFKPGFH